jgi:hypothetical protein
LEQVSRRLDERFRLLTRGRRDAEPRQQTLRALIDWSYDLLDEREQRLFRRAAIFVDGFTLEAAHEMCGDEGPDEFDVLDTLDSLVDKSLVVAEGSDEAKRYRLLESTRAYALELLKDGEHARLAARHLQFFRELAERAEDAWATTGRDTAFIELLIPELEDVRAAMRWALRGGDPFAGAVLAATTARPWSRLGFTVEGIAHLEAFIAAIGDADVRLTARLWTALALLLDNTMRTARALEAAERGVAFARASGDPATLHAALWHYASIAARLRRFDAADAAIGEAEPLEEFASSPGPRLNRLEIVGLVALLRGDLAKAARSFEAQRELLDSLGDAYAAANARLALAEVEHARGRTERAIQLASDILPDADRLLGHERHANLLANLAGYLAAAGDASAARVVAVEAIALMAEADPSSVVVAIALEHLALALALDGADRGAALLLGYCEARFADAGFEREFTERATHERLTAILYERLSSDELCALASAGASLEPRRAIHQALSAGGTGSDPSAPAPSDKS